MRKNFAEKAFISSLQNHLSISNIGLREAAKELSERGCEISASSLPRITSNSKKLELEEFLAICNWLGQKPASFFVDEEESIRPQKTVRESIRDILSQTNRLNSEFILAIDSLIKYALGEETF